MLQCIFYFTPSLCDVIQYMFLVGTVCYCIDYQQFTYVKIIDRRVIQCLYTVFFFRVWAIPIYLLFPPRVCLQLQNDDTASGHKAINKWFSQYSEEDLDCTNPRHQPRTTT